MMTVRWGKGIRAHPLLAIILFAFILLAAIYSVATPIFEAGDEIWHFPFVQHLATGHSLPVQDPAVKTLWEQEGGQPPLYYALGALATFWIDTGDLPDRLWMNPEAKIGIPLAYGNKNLIVHTSAEDFPWHNTALAVHLLRFISILLSAGTVALTYFLALEIKAGDKTLAALAAAVAAGTELALVGVTLSEKQAEYANELIARTGLGNRVMVRLQDYRDLHGKPFDKIVSVGMFEHVGRSHLPEYFAQARRLLKPGGLFLNGDQVTGRNPESEELIQTEWRKKIEASSLSREAKDAAYHRMSFDKTAALEQNLCWLEEAGFREVDVFYKYFNFAVMFGKR